MGRQLGVAKWVGALLLLLSPPLLSFPQLVRYGYPNCTSCHVSPNGGGLLTRYGRALSEEIVSTWSQEGEGAFAYGAAPLPDWLLLGGDFQELQFYQKTPTFLTEQFFWMQNDLEAAVTLGAFTLDSTLGVGNTAGTLSGLLSRRHYLRYHPNDTLYFRAGLFTQPYGINLSDHTIVTRAGLLLDQSQLDETYNLEAAYVGEAWDVFVSGSLGRPDDPTRVVNKGVTVRSSVTLSDSYKIGASFLTGTNPKGGQTAFGPYAILGWSKRSFLYFEYDLRSTYVTGSPSPGMGSLAYTRLDVEPIQGIHLFLSGELADPVLGDNKAVYYPGAGIQWFPRPHFEIKALGKLIMLPQSQNIQFAYLLLHFYP